MYLNKDYLLFHSYSGVSVDGGCTKYYTENRFHARFPWEERNISHEMNQMEKIEHLPTINAKLSAASRCGYTGSSILNLLYHLYKFDVCQDLVRDVMHLVPMNCAKKVFKRVIEENSHNRNEMANRMDNYPYSYGKYFSLP